MEVVLTDHSYKRAKERMSLSRKALKRHSEKAFIEGLRHSDLNGRARKVVDAIFLKQKSANQIRVYGNHLFLFSDNVLITLFELPKPIKKYVNNIKKVKR